MPRCVVFMREQGDGTLNIRIMEIRKKRIINARRICYTGWAKQKQRIREREGKSEKNRIEIINIIVIIMYYTHPTVAIFVFWLAEQEQADFLFLRDSKSVSHFLSRRTLLWTGVVSVLLLWNFVPSSVIPVFIIGT